TDAGDVNGTGTASAAIPAALTADGPGSFVVHGRIRDKDGSFTDYTTTVAVTDVAPTAALSNNGPVNEASPVTVAFANPFDPSAADTTTGFPYTSLFRSAGTGDVTGTATASAAIPAAHPANGPGSQTVRIRIQDKDGGFTDYTTTISI